MSRKPWHRPTWINDPIILRRWHLLISAAFVGVMLAAVLGVTAYLADAEADRVAKERRTDAQLQELVRQELCTEAPQVCEERRQESIIEAIRQCAKDEECLTELRQTAGPSRARLLAHAREAVARYCAVVGCKGETGPPGPKGDRGASGQRGGQGRRGPPGRSRRGPRGTQGPQGSKGSPGPGSVTVPDPPPAPQVPQEPEQTARDALCDALVVKPPFCP